MEKEYRRKEKVKVNLSASGGSKFKISDSDLKTCPYP
jgi:hypothetical protein